MLCTYSHLGLSYDSWRNQTVGKLRRQISDYNSRVFEFVRYGDRLKLLRAKHANRDIYRPEKRIAVEEKLNKLSIDYEVCRLSLALNQERIDTYKVCLNTAAMKHYGRRMQREIKATKNAVMLCRTLRFFLDAFEKEVREIDAIMESIKTGRP